MADMFGPLCAPGWEQLLVLLFHFLEDLGPLRPLARAWVGNQKSSCITSLNRSPLSASGHQCSAAAFIVGVLLCVIGVCK